MVSETPGVKPRYPIYIPSKGRWARRLTINMLEADDVPYYLVIEPQEYELYAQFVDPKKILVLPFSNLGQGSIPARNWIWDHAKAAGAYRFWTLDDNIRRMRIYDGYKRRYVYPGYAIRLMEDFTDRYENVAQSGPHYTFFSLASKPTASAERRQIPFYLNRRIYSFTLNLTELPYRYRGRYNEDTDLSLRVLKAGWCTILFLMIMCDKVATMTLPGGNTDELYQRTETFDGRLAMAQSLCQQHPDVTTITRKWGRWQHHVDYRPFRFNRLKRKPEDQWIG